MGGEPDCSFMVCVMFVLSPRGLRHKHSLKNHKLIPNAPVQTELTWENQCYHFCRSYFFLGFRQRARVMLTQSSEHPSVAPQLLSRGKTFGLREVSPPCKVCRRWEEGGSTNVLFMPRCPQFKRLSPPQEHVHHSYLVPAALLLVRSWDKQESMELL